MGNQFRISFTQVLAILFIAVGLAACAKSDGTLVLTVSQDSNNSAGNPSPSPSPSPDPGTQPNPLPIKNLFSKWMDSSNTFQIDLAQCAFNMTRTASVALITGETCTCQALVTGTQTAGNIVFSNCSSATCTQFAGTFAYTNTTSGLQACRAGSCINLR